MAKGLVLEFGGREVQFALARVERSDLYGKVRIDTLDPQGRLCSQAILASDGRTLVGSGGSALVVHSADGKWLERSSLQAVDTEGQPVTPAPSSLGVPISLTDRATVSELLDHTIRAVYLLEPDSLESDDTSSLTEALAGGTIFRIPFSYRGGLQVETGFVLQGYDGNLFLLVGAPAALVWSDLAVLNPPLDDEPEAEESEDDLDFSMF